MTLIRRALESRVADPTAEWGSSRIPTNAESGGYSGAGVPINEKSAMALMMVYTCVSILADGVASLDMGEYETNPDGTQSLVEDQPLVITNPWPEGTAVDFYTQVMVSLTLRGNSYNQIVTRDRMGYPETLMPIHPDAVWARRVNGKREYRVNGNIVPTDDMFHIPGLLMPGEFVGCNPVEYMRRNWGVSAAAETFGGRFFQNSANPSGILSTDEDLDDDQVLAMAIAWKQAHQGAANANLPAILTGGTKWTQVSINPDDAQFIATRELGNSDILSFFRVPPHMVGQTDKTTSWGTGIEQMKIGYYGDTLGPWTKRINSAMTRVRPPGRICRFNVESQLRGDTTQRFNNHMVGINAGFLTVNQALKKEGLPGIGPEGDVHWRPMNFAPAQGIIDGTHKPSAGGPGGGAANEPTAPAPGVDTDDTAN